MSAFQRKSFIGKGPIYLQEVGSDTGLVQVGNASVLELAIEEETKEQQDYTNPGGGLYDQVSRITGMNANVTLHDLTPENIAIAVRGTTTEVAAGLVEDEEHTAYQHGVVALNHVPNLDESVTVKNEAGTETYVLDEDYALGNSVIRILDGDIANGTKIKVTYTKQVGRDVEALTVAAKTYRLFWDGINEANGEPMPVELYNIRFTPATALALIGDEFAELQLTAAVLRDETRSGTGVSQYAKFRTV